MNRLLEARLSLSWRVRAAIEFFANAGPFCAHRSTLVTPSGRVGDVFTLWERWCADCGRPLHHLRLRPR